MSYTALYRKFRPDTFSSVKGQQHIVTALKNQINSGRIGHAYLFCGTRGTGKTTIAKVFAKAVNCLNPIDGSPCNECSMCEAINQQTSLNVIEIDAASNNSVENIRQIIEEVSYSPTEGKYKVYIVDEVHMLSQGAFNALLKTLEEPPSYVIFILATTEAHKLPVTILSRCQRYDFKRIQVETIVERLKELTQKEGIEAEDKALNYIAKNADGALRDALSLLEQCSAFYFGETLTYDKVLEVLGTVDTDIFMKMFEALIHSKVTKVVKLMDELIMEGKDISQFVINFTWFLRNVMMIKSTDASADIADLPSDIREELRVKAVDVSIDTVLRFIRILSELSNQLRYATQKRVLVETTFVKLCKPEMETEVDALVQRVEALENKIKGNLVVATSVEEEPEPEEDLEKQIEIVKALPEDVKEVVKHWDDIVRKSEEPLRHMILNAKVHHMGESGLVVNIDNEMYFKLVNKELYINTLKNVVFSVINKDVDLTFVYLQNDSTTSNNDMLVDLRRFSDMDIEIDFDNN